MSRISSDTMVQNFDIEEDQSSNTFMEYRSEQIEIKDNRFESPFVGISESQRLHGTGVKLQIGNDIENQEKPTEFNLRDENI